MGTLSRASRGLRLPLICAIIYATFVCVGNKLYSEELQGEMQDTMRLQLGCLQVSDLWRLHDGLRILNAVTICGF